MSATAVTNLISPVQQRVSLATPAWWSFSSGDATVCPPVCLSVCLSAHAQRCVSIGAQRRRCNPRSMTAKLSAFRDMNMHELCAYSEQFSVHLPKSSALLIGVILLSAARVTYYFTNELSALNLVVRKCSVCSTLVHKKQSGSQS